MSKDNEYKKRGSVILKNGKPVLTKDDIEKMTRTFASLSKGTTFGAIDELTAKAGVNTTTKMATSISVNGMSAGLDVAVDIGEGKSVKNAVLVNAIGEVTSNAIGEFIVGSIAETLGIAATGGALVSAGGFFATVGVTYVLQSYLIEPGLYDATKLTKMKNAEVTIGDNSYQVDKNKVSVEDSNGLGYFIDSISGNWLMHNSYIPVEINGAKDRKIEVMKTGDGKAQLRGSFEELKKIQDKQSLDSHFAKENQKIVNVYDYENYSSKNSIQNYAEFNVGSDKTMMYAQGTGELLNDLVSKYYNTYEEIRINDAGGEKIDIIVTQGTTSYSLRALNLNEIKREALSRGFDFEGSKEAWRKFKKINLENYSSDHRVDEHCFDSKKRFILLPQECVEENQQNADVKNILFPLIGNENDNEIYGTHKSDTLKGKGGNDIIKGWGQTKHKHGNKDKQDIIRGAPEMIRYTEGLE